jgi:hypothetical protein
VASVTLFAASLLERVLDADDVRALKQVGRGGREKIHDFLRM